MGKLKMIEYPPDSVDYVLVPKRIIDKLTKKTMITNQYIVDGTRRKIVIEYRSIKGSNCGVIELYDNNEKLEEEN